MWMFHNGILYVGTPVEVQTTLVTLRFAKADPVLSSLDSLGILAPGSSVNADQIIGTLAAKKPLHLRVSIPEDQLRHIKVGGQATVTAAAYPDQTLAASVKSLSSLPYANRQFDCVLTVKLGKLADSILPTMNARAEFKVEQEDKPKAEPGSTEK
jgi:hypothetical protein